MKKIILITIFIITSFTVTAQPQLWIDSIEVHPQNAVVGDTIKLMCHLSLSKAGCFLTKDSLVQNGNNFIGEAWHCVGVFDGPCWATDTFFLTDLPVGNYKFFYWPGFTDTCNWGSAPFPATVDSVLFSITSQDGIQELNSCFSVRNNLSPNIFNLNFTCPQQKIISVFDLSGRNIFQIETRKENLNIDLANQVAGIYFIQVVTDEKVFNQKIIIQ